MVTEYEKIYKARSPRVIDPLANYRAREECISTFGFAILTEAAIRMLKPYAPFIEVGAGTGYWAFELQKRGIVTVATDPLTPGKSKYRFKKQWTVVEKLTAKKTIKKYPKYTLLLVWPCYAKPWAYEALKAYKGGTLVYCGEGRGGCTADDNFHELLEMEWEESLEIPIPQWFGIYDYLTIYTRINYG